MRCLGYETADMQSPYGHIVAALRLGLLDGVKETIPASALSREDVYTLLCNMLDTKVAVTDPITLEILYPDEIGEWESTTGKKLERYTLYETAFLGKNSCKFNGWVITVLPTASTDGEKYRVCAVCGKKEILTIPKFSKSDVNGDGTVSLIDVLLVIKNVLSLR